VGGGPQRRSTGYPRSAPAITRWRRHRHAADRDLATDGPLAAPKRAARRVTFAAIGGPQWFDIADGPALIAAEALKQIAELNRVEAEIIVAAAPRSAGRSGKQKTRPVAERRDSAR
jgi:hypothetical protein